MSNGNDQNLTVSNLTVQDSTTLNGPVEMIRTNKGVNVGSYTAPTDGFLVGSIWVTPGTKSLSSAYISCESNGGYSCSASGGNASGSKALPYSNSFTMPVAKGSGLSLKFECTEGDTDLAQFWFQWIPLGANLPLNYVGS